MFLKTALFLLHTQGSTVLALCALAVFHPVLYQLLFEFK